MRNISACSSKGHFVFCRTPLPLPFPTCCCRTVDINLGYAAVVSLSPSLSHSQAWSWLRGRRFGRETEYLLLWHCLELSSGLIWSHLQVNNQVNVCTCVFEHEDTVLSHHWAVLHAVGKCDWDKYKRQILSFFFFFLKKKCSKGESVNRGGCCILALPRPISLIKSLVHSSFCKHISAPLKCISTKGWVEWKPHRVAAFHPGSKEKLEGHSEGKTEPEAC